MKTDIEILKDIFEDYNIDSSECYTENCYISKLTDQEKVNWHYISKTYELSDYLLGELLNYIEIEIYLDTFKVSEKFLEENWGRFYNDNDLQATLLSTHKLSEEFLLLKFNPKQCRNSIIFDILIEQDLSEQSFKLYYEVLKSFNINYRYSLWKNLISENKVSENIIKLYKDDIPEKVWDKVYE